MRSCRIECPGVDDKTIRFATAIAGDPGAQQAMLATMRKSAEWMNLDTRGDLRNPNFSPRYRPEFIKAYRLWEITPWFLRGAPESWPGQRAAYYDRRPVFAVIGGMVGGAGERRVVADGPWIVP